MYSSNFDLAFLRPNISEIVGEFQKFSLFFRNSRYRNAWGISEILEYSRGGGIVALFEYTHTSFGDIDHHHVSFNCELFESFFTKRDNFVGFF